MIVSTLSTIQGGVASPLQRQEILAPYAGAGGNVYRRVLYMRFATGDAAERIEIGAAATLRASFAAYDYNAIATPIEALRAKRVTGHGGVVITLDAARQVTHIGLSTARDAQTQTIELYRLDGDTPSVEPTVTASRIDSIALAAMAEGAVAMGGGGGRTAPHSSSMSGESVLLMIHGDADAGFAVPDDSNVGVHYVSFASGPFGVDLVDARFLIRARNAANAIVPLSASDVTRVTVRSYPRNPRLGISLPTDPASPAALDSTRSATFWNAAGEGDVDAGTGLSAELARGLDRFAALLRDTSSTGSAPAPLPASLDAALVIESDAPCVFEPEPVSSGSTFHLDYALVRHSFNDGREKAVLRFDPRRVASAEIPLLLPSGALPISAKVEFDCSLPSGRPSGGEDGFAQADLGTLTAVRVTTERAAAQPIQLADATTVAALALGVMPLHPNSEVTVELRAEAPSSPAGSILSSVTLPAGAVGQRHWLLARLAEPIIVSTLPHWLIVRAAAGHLLWLTRPGADTLRSFDEQNRMLVPAGLIEGVSTLHALLSAGGSHGGAAPFSLSLAGQPVTLEGEANGRRTADLSAAAAAVAPSPAGPATAFALRFEAAGPGIITVYPPRLTYELDASG